MSSWRWRGTVLFALAAVALTVVLFYARAPQNVPYVPDVDGKRFVTQELDVPPPLATAYDICVAPDSRFAHFPLDGHFEADLVQNAGQLNEVKYHLFWQVSRQLSIIIEESRAGQQTMKRTDPHTEQFDNCVRTKKVEEVVPRQ